MGHGEAGQVAFPHGAIAAAEASLLRSLVGQIMALVEPEESAVIIDPDPRGPAGTRDAAEAAEVAALEAMVHGPGSESPPDDPVLARLLPDGYRDDPDSAGEFRKYTEPALRSAKYQAAQEMLDTLPDEGGRIQRGRRGRRAGGDGARARLRVPARRPGAGPAAA